MPGIEVGPEVNDERVVGRTRAHDASDEASRRGFAHFGVGLTISLEMRISQGADLMARAALFARQGPSGLRLFSRSGTVSEKPHTPESI